MATVEYAALVVLVSLVTAAGGAAVDAQRIPRALAAQVGRALCLVQGGDCLGRGAPRPCVLRADERSRETRVSILVGRFADGRTVVREVRSDGSVAVTVLLSDEAGGAVAVGARLRWRGRGVAADAEASAKVRGAFGRRFVVSDGAAADRLVAQLAADDPPALGAVGGIAAFLLGRADAAHERSVELGGRAQAEGVLAAIGLEARADVLAGVAEGVRVDRRTGERTVVLRLDRAMGATLAAPLGLRAGGERADELVVEIAFDRGGAPLSLTVAGATAVHGDAAIREFDASGGDRLEVEARLDLSDPAARALAGDVLDRARSADPAALAAARALAKRMADRARIDVRVYEMDRSERASGGALALGAEAGFEVVHTTESARLVAAHGREPGLGWSQRLDCVAPA